MRRTWPIVLRELGDELDEELTIRSDTKNRVEALHVDLALGIELELNRVLGRVPAQLLRDFRGEILFRVTRVLL